MQQMSVSYTERTQEFWCLRSVWETAFLVLIQYTLHILNVTRVLCHNLDCVLKWTMQVKCQCNGIFPHLLSLVILLTALLKERMWYSDPLLLGVVFQLRRAFRISSQLKTVWHYKTHRQDFVPRSLILTYSRVCRTTMLPVVSGDSFLEVMQVALRGLIVCLLWQRVVVESASG